MGKKVFTEASLSTFVDEIKTYTNDAVATKVPTSRTVNGKSLSNNITLSASDVGTYTKTEIDNVVSKKAQVQIITWEDDD